MYKHIHTHTHTQLHGLSRHVYTNINIHMYKHIHTHTHTHSYMGYPPLPPHGSAYGIPYAMHHKQVCQRRPSIKVKETYKDLHTAHVTARSAHGMGYLVPCTTRRMHTHTHTRARAHTQQDIIRGVHQAGDGAHICKPLHTLPCHMHTYIYVYILSHTHTHLFTAGTTFYQGSW